MKNNSNQTNIVQYLKNPFEFIAGFKALGLGTAFLILSIVLGVIFNARFDGVLNLHFVGQVSFMNVVVDQLINFASVATMFYLVARIAGASGIRFIDVAGTQLLAMAPYSILPLLNYNNLLYSTSKVLMDQFTGRETGGDLNIGWLTISGIIMLMALIWMISLMYKAYKICSNFKSTRLVVSFVAALLLAVILSKYLIIQIA